MGYFFLRRTAEPSFFLLLEGTQEVIMTAVAVTGLVRYTQRYTQVIQTVQLLSGFVQILFLAIYVELVVI